MTKQLKITKIQNLYETSWCVEANGVEFCEVRKAGRSRAHGYWVEFADRRESVWFGSLAFLTARRALNAATNYARAKALVAAESVK